MKDKIIELIESGNVELAMHLDKGQGTNIVIEHLSQELYTLQTELYKSLDALCMMWNQYCPPPLTHMHMSAGEYTEKILNSYDLIKEDGEAFYLDYNEHSVEIPKDVVKLLKYKYAIGDKS